MFDFLKRLFAPQREEHRIELPGVTVAFNHKLKLAFLYSYDSSTQPTTYAELEKHLLKRGYILNVIVASAGMPLPPTDSQP